MVFNMKENCNGCKKCINERLSEYKIVPFACELEKMHSLFSFFLYCAPDIESCHSFRLDEKVHADVFEKMMEGRHFEYQRFCPSNAKIEKELDNGFLSGDEICLKCKRFVCKKYQAKKGKPKETDLDCFLRHIRNSIAHGGVYCRHAGNRIHIVFEDENSSKKLTARIVCIRADLEHWEKILSDKRLLSIGQ